MWNGVPHNVHYSELDAFWYDHNLRDVNAFVNCFEYRVALRDCLDLSDRVA